MNKAHGLNRVAAQISNKVYQDPQKHKENAGYNDLGKWKFLKSSKESLDGYFGAAFRLDKTIIIASRGTEFFDFKDLESDLKLFFGERLDQLDSAIIFSKSIINEYKAKGVNQFVFVGHSLGGLLSQILSLEFNSYAITFDSPGAYKVAVNHFGKGLFDTSNITSFVSAPNVFNSNGPHLTREVNEIKFFSDPGEVSYLDYLKYSKEQHSIKNLLNQFDTSTDLPNNMVIHRFWPSNRLSGYENYLRNDELWKEQYGLRQSSLNAINKKREKLLKELRSEYLEISDTISQLPKFVYGAAKFMEGIGLLTGFNDGEENCYMGDCLDS